MFGSSHRRESVKQITLLISILRKLSVSSNIFKLYQSYYLLSSDPKAPKAPRPPKQPDIRDYQFYPHELIPLLEQEVYAYRKQVNYKVPIDPEAENPKKKQKAEQEKIDSAEALTEDQISKKLFCDDGANFNFFFFRTERRLFAAWVWNMVQERLQCVHQRKRKIWQRRY
jgi:hypothetical protein